MAISLVYSIHCKVNNKQYIGSTSDFYKRRKEHVWQLERGDHHCKHLQNAWNKYGKKTFVFRVVYRCGIEELIQLEQKAMDETPKALLFNHCLVAGTTRGIQHSSATRDSMKLAAIKHGAKESVRRQRAETGRQRAIEGTLNLGGNHSTETKQKMSEAAKRVAADPEERKRRSERAKAQHAKGKLGQATWSDEVKKRMSALVVELIRKHGHKGRTAGLGDSAEMSRRSYQRELFRDQGA